MPFLSSCPGASVSPHASSTLKPCGPSGSRLGWSSSLGCTEGAGFRVWPLWSRGAPGARHRVTHGRPGEVTSPVLHCPAKRVLEAAQEPDQLW